jgi:hypothetical protein
MTNEEQSEDAKRQAGDARAEAARLQVAAANQAIIDNKLRKKKEYEQVLTTRTASLQLL